MELKDFVKKVIMDLDSAVTGANSETDRQVRFRESKDQQTTLEFDVAVTVESTESGHGGGEIKVLGFAQLGATGSLELRNSVVSRVSFGIDIGHYTKEESRVHDTQLENHFNYASPTRYN